MPSIQPSGGLGVSMHLTDILRVVKEMLQVW